MSELKSPFDHGPIKGSDAREALFHHVPTAYSCEVCDRPEGDLCDDCANEERERDLERAERLAEEDRYLYGI